jgi:hypothetical protein
MKMLDTHILTHPASATPNRRPGGARRLTRIAIAAIAGAVMLTATVLPASSAVAGGYTLLKSFPGEFGSESPVGVAVDDSTGDVFALDKADKRVEVFSSEGKQLSGFEFTGLPPEGFSAATYGLAVDNSTEAGDPSKRDLYVVDGGNKVVDKFKPNGEKYELETQLAVPEPRSVTVDPKGDVYVANRSPTDVRVFEPDGTELKAITNEHLTAASGAAIAPNGSLYVMNFLGSVWKLTLGPEDKVESASEVTPEALAIAVDSSSDAYVVEEAAGGFHVAEYEPNGKTLVEDFGAGAIGESYGIVFSSFGGDSDIYVADGQNHEVHLFEKKSEGGSERPEVRECGATTSTPAGEIVACTVVPHAEEATWHVEYEEQGSGMLINTGVVHTINATNLTETEPVRVEEALKGLQPQTGYRYLLVAENKSKPGAVSEEGTFTTASAVKSVGRCTASAVEKGHATLRGSLEPFEIAPGEGVETTLFFQYGQTTKYESKPTKALVTSVAVTAEAPVGGQEPAEPPLQPHTTYHCRLVASDSYGTTDGEDGTFDTPPVPPAVNDRPPAASQVTRRTAMLSGTVNPENSATKYHFVYVDHAAYQVGTEANAPNPYRTGGSTEAANAIASFGDVAAGPLQVSGLRPGTTYDYALVAENEFNETETGLDHQFTTAPPTPPVVAGGTATEVTQTGATISATIDPQGLPTGYEVDLGTELPYNGAEVFGKAGQNEGEVTITLVLQSLLPGTTYHYRIVATNEDGSAESSDQTFTTPGVPSPLVQPPAAPLLTVPSISFPTESGTVISHKPPTRAQKLANALKACKKKPRKRRAACMRQAHKKYG